MIGGLDGDLEARDGRMRTPGVHPPHRVEIEDFNRHSMIYPLFSVKASAAEILHYEFLSPSCSST